jgi:oligoendopeptidase F
MKDAWDLTLLYVDINDPALERDVSKTERAAAAFAKKYASGKFAATATTLARALKEYEALFATIAPPKPLLYAHYKSDLNATDTTVTALLASLSGRYSKVSAALVFFELAIGRIPKRARAALLKHPVLAPYRLFIERAFAHAAHALSDAEERILVRTHQPRKELWVAGVRRSVANLTVAIDTKAVPLAEAMNSMHEMPTAKRRAVHLRAMEALQTKAEFAESELNAVLINRAISDDLRAYPHPWSATMQGYELSDATVSAIRDGVARARGIAHRFYTLKAQLLKLSSLTYADRGAKIGTLSHSFSFAESREIYTRTIGALHPAFSEVFTRMVSNGQIDVYPKAGKTGGAYASNSVGNPSFVLLNHVGSFRSLSTLAHEMGHATHFELSKKQQPFYQDVSTAVTETASTLFEGLVADALLPTLKPKDRTIMLHDLLDDAMATVFRQVACFEFEAALHAESRATGFVSTERILQLHNEHMGNYLGPSLRMQKNDGYFFVTWSHLRNPFYVISYVYGYLLSLNMRAKLAQDPSYINQIYEFLSLGSSKTPEKIFKTIGIDTTKPETFTDGLMDIERKLDELTLLVKK